MKESTAFVCIVGFIVICLICIASAYQFSPNGAGRSCEAACGPHRVKVCDITNGKVSHIECLKEEQ